MKMKTLCTILSAGLFFAGTANAGPVDRVLRFGVNVSKMGNLDPHLAAGSQDRALADMVFNGLLRYQPGNAPTIEPDLAASIPEFEMIDGRQVWTFSLRKGVLFHPGPLTAPYELTAEDVVYSLRKSAEKTTSAYAGEYAGMTFETVDAYTLRITPERPLSAVLFLAKFTNYGGGFIVSKRAVETMGLAAFQKHPVGTGPFRFKRYEMKEKVVLASHREYFRGRPLLDGVEIHFAPDGKKRAEDLLSGKLDVVIASGDTGWINMMAGKKGISIDPHGVGEITTIYFNTTIKPLDDVRVRRAIAYALTKEDFISDMDATFVGGAAYSPVPANLLPGGLTREEAEHLGLAYDTDLKKARRLLAETGYPEGFSLSMVSSEKRLYRRYYETLSNNLARIGITFVIDILPHGEMHKRIRTDPQPIVIYGAWRPNADVYLTRFFHSDSIVVTGANPDTNFSHYDKVDKLIEAARIEIDPIKQVNLWIQAQIRILDDMAAYPVMTTNQCYLRKKNVDYGHPLVSTMALYPQFTEKTRFVQNR
ncbi:MAG: ABC transporter substrate-binding protein [Pseudomonadota bacterium]